MKDLPELDFITDAEPNATTTRTGWEAVRFELADEEDEDTLITEDFFVTFVTLCLKIRFETLNFFLLRVRE